VRDDLHGVEISYKELQQLTNLPVNNKLVIISSPLKQMATQWLSKVRGSEGATVVFIGFSTLVFAYLLFVLFVKIFVTWITIPAWALLILLGFWFCGILQIILYFLWRRKNNLLRVNITHSLQILLKEVDRYNAIIKAIDINDQIEAAGNLEVSLQEREKIIAALKFTRSDLVRALKTERILRENKSFILSNTELFANNLATLATMQVTEQATEHGRLLNEALQIALDVQQEMRKLQSQH
jgi:hypothetical protein